MNELVIYKCDICGEEIEVLKGASKSLTCCGQAMREIRANSVDAAVEKHFLLIQLKEK